MWNISIRNSPVDMDSMVMSRCALSPSGDLEEPYVFEQVVVGGAVPKNYFPAVEKGIQESVLEGSSGSLSGCWCEGSSL